MSFESVQERSMCEYATHMTLVINPLYTFLEYVLWQNVKSCTYVKMCVAVTATTTMILGITVNLH